MAFVDIIVKAVVFLALAGVFSVVFLVLLNKRLAADVDRTYSRDFDARESVSSFARTPGQRGVEVLDQSIEAEPQQSDDTKEVVSETPRNPRNSQMQNGVRAVV